MTIEERQKIMRPHLRKLMPEPAQIPGHWRRRGGDALALHVPTPGARGTRLVPSLAWVGWNGPNAMAELRFEVYDPAAVFSFGSLAPGVGRFGACNDFCQAPGLAERLSGPHYNLHARGLQDPTKEDVIEVVRWADEQLRLMYERAGLPFLAYRGPGWVAPQAEG